jgi:hypothetical protein
LEVAENEGLSDEHNKREENYRKEPCYETNWMRVINFCFYIFRWRIQYEMGSSESKENKS